MEKLMTFRKMIVMPVVLVVAACALSAFQAKPVDLSGVWTGTFTLSPGNERTARMELKHKGAELTGTAGPDAERQMPIGNGKVTTAKGVTTVTFDATEGNDRVIKFDLKVTDGRLKGKAVTEANGEKREALVDVGRAK
jgi:hypothetical protein